MKPPRVRHFLWLFQKLWSSLRLSTSQKQRLRHTIIKISSNISLYSVLIYVLRYLFSFGVKETYRALQTKSTVDTTREKQQKGYRVVPASHIRYYKRQKAPNHYANREQRFADDDTSSTTTQSDTPMLNMSLNDSSFLVSDDQFIHPRWVVQSGGQHDLQGLLQQRFDRMEKETARLQKSIDLLNEQHSLLLVQLGHRGSTSSSIKDPFNTSCLDESPFDTSPPKN